MFVVHQATYEGHHYDCLLFSLSTFYLSGKSNITEDKKHIQDVNKSSS